MSSPASFDCVVWSRCGSIGVKCSTPVVTGADVGLSQRTMKDSGTDL